MNSFLDVRNLYPVQTKYCDSIPLEFDEPAYSYLTRLMLLIPSTDRLGIVEKYFGNRHCRVDKPLHAGFGTFANHFSNRDHGLCDDVIDAHSMLSFFKPFTDSERYSNACELARGVRGSGMHKAVGLRGERVFREQPVICLRKR